MSEMSADGSGDLFLAAGFVSVTDGFGVEESVFWILACSSDLSLRGGFVSGAGGFGTGANGFRVVACDNGCSSGLALGAAFFSAAGSFEAGANGLRIVAVACCFSGGACFTAFGEEGGNDDRATGPVRVTERRLGDTDCEGEDRRAGDGESRDGEVDVTCEVGLVYPWAWAFCMNSTPDPRFFEKSSLFKNT